jgi:hypothetical protein
MTDEFIKGLTLFVLGALGWITFAGWYRTPSYYVVAQLVGEPQGVNTTFGEIGVLAGDVFVWLMVLGPLTFWLLIPASRELRASGNEDAAN